MLNLNEQKSHLTTTQNVKPQFGVELLSAMDANPVTLNITAVNDTIKQRERNNRDNITQALRAGRILSEHLKPQIPHGEWRQWVLDNTDYVTVRAYQSDIQLWEAWKGYADQLVELGIVKDVRQPEYELVSDLDDETVSTSLSALQLFMRKGTPDSALDMAIKDLQRENSGTTGLSIKRAGTLIETAKAIEELPEVDRQTARTLYNEHNLTNPDIIRQLPNIRSKAPDIIDDMMASGFVNVPGVNNGQGRAVNLSNASLTDIELSMGDADVTNELQYQNDKRQQREEREETGRKWKFEQSIEGSRLSIIEQLKIMMDNPDTLYKVNLFIEKEG